METTNVLIADAADLRSAAERTAIPAQGEKVTLGGRQRADLGHGETWARILTVPSGWNVKNGTILTDKHGRTRITVRPVQHEAEGPDGRTVTETMTTEVGTPALYAGQIVYQGLPLVLDRWATPGRMIGEVGERIDALTRVLRYHRQLDKYSSYAAEKHPAHPTWIKRHQEIHEVSTLLHKWRDLHSRLIAAL